MEDIQILALPLVQARPHFDGNGRLRLARKGMDRGIRWFLIVFSALSLASVVYLNINWATLLKRLPDLAEVFGKLSMLSFENPGLTGMAMLESITVTLLATVYSLLLGLAFGALMARNLVRSRVLSAVLSAVFSFIRAVPTPVWVLFALVCLGFGPAPGVVGLSLHATAFFARSFKQVFEEVSEDTIESLKATGANGAQIFFGAVLPASLTQLVAVGALRFEINFSESAILGMVGAGGIGYTIMAAMSGYQLGRAGLAILLVFLFSYAIELSFVALKRRLRA